VAGVVAASDGDPHLGSDAADVDVAALSHCGATMATCVSAVPESKGGSEATVRVAKADLVPTDANLLELGRVGRRVRTVRRQHEADAPVC